jgi:SAM-dependent methyltransferase
MKLYTDLARIYNIMYPKIFDYAAEFDYYSALLTQYRCQKIVEIGCGTGLLSHYFVDHLYSYLGVDLFEQMLTIARQTVPTGRFIQGDMRNLRLKDPYDAVLITGKSFCHMITNADVMNCMESVYRTLKPGGILVFDNFNATEIFKDFKTTTEFRVDDGENSYKWISNHKIDFTTGFTWTWSTTYFIVEKGNKKMTQDTMTIRAFTRDELELFLRLGKLEPIGYEVPEKDPKKIIYVAKKPE